MSTYPTLSDLWALAFPPETRLLGGEGGLERTVEWVTLLRPTYPLFPELGEGYLALASPRLAQQVDPQMSLSRLIQELARVGAAGLIVDEFPPDEAVALAETFSFPLFYVPPETDLRALERETLRTILDREGQQMRREAEARQRYDNVFAEGGIPAVLEALYTAGILAAVKDADGRLVAAVSDYVAHQAPERDVAIVVGGKALGSLLVKPFAEINPALLDILVRPAAEVCGLELLRRATRQETEEELGADLIEQVLYGSIEEAALMARLKRLGYDSSLGRCHVALALREHDAPADRVSGTLMRDLAWLAAREKLSFIILPYREVTVCLVSFSAMVGERLLRQWIDRAFGLAPKGIALGVGRVVEALSALRRTIEQAIAALDLGQRIRGLAAPYYYEDLGLYRLLVGLHAREDLWRFYEETLGALVAYDQTHSTELVPTLKAFFAQNANAAQTARCLNIHRNTLNYRLERIVEITGLDLDDAEARLALQLALKIHDLAL